LPCLPPVRGQRTAAQRRSPSAAWFRALATRFDIARAAQAAAVQARLMHRSMLASSDFENVAVLLERLSLGPFSRRG
jgi:hypothetical protein